MDATASAILSVLDGIFIHYRNKVLKVSLIEIGFCFTPKLAVLRVQLNTNRKLEVANWLKEKHPTTTQNSCLGFDDDRQKDHPITYLAQIFSMTFFRNEHVSYIEQNGYWVMFQSVSLNKIFKLLCFYLHQCLYVCPSHSSTLATSFI